MMMMVYADAWADGDDYGDDGGGSGDEDDGNDDKDGHNADFDDDDDKDTQGPLDEMHPADSCIRRPLARGDNTHDEE